MNITAFLYDYEINAANFYAKTSAPYPAYGADGNISIYRQFHHRGR